jgi:hypothetical protein
MWSFVRPTYLLSLYIQLMLAEANFLINNYKQALEIITTHTPILRETMAELNITSPSIFGTWIQEEYDYLHDLRQEPTGDVVLKMEYLVLLRKLEPVE